MGKTQTGSKGDALPRVASIDPHLPFLRTLATNLYHGSLVEGFSPVDDLLSLSRATIYLPTRRAARALTSEFMGLTGQEATLLPRILTIGDGDETLANSVEAANQPIAIGSLEQQLHIARLVSQWFKAVSVDVRQLFQDENIVFPSSTADAIWFAKMLADLMNQIEANEVPAQAILDLDSEDMAQWWKLTTPFFQILLEHWPEFLAENGLVDPATLRRRIIDQRTKELQERLDLPQANDPVIAAGSTGSIAATARFLKAISLQPKGLLILPGLDFDMEQSAFDGLNSPKDDFQQATMPAHPQFGLAKLLKELGVHRDQVERLEYVDRDSNLAERDKVVSLAMLPSQFCDQWMAFNTRDKAEEKANVLAKAFDPVSLVEADTEHQEAIAISLILRQVLEEDQKTAALVTPNRDLARRVSLEMKRYGVQIDDSGGQSLSNTLCGRLLRLLLTLLNACANAEPDPISAAAFIKHPLLRLGQGEDSVDRFSRLMELNLFRGKPQIPLPGEYAEFLESEREKISSNFHLPAAVRSMGDDDWNAIIELSKKLDQYLKPLIDVVGQEGTCGPAAFAFNIRSALEQLTIDETGETLLYQSEAGLVLSNWFDELCAPRTQIAEIPAREIAKSLDALLNGVLVRPPGSSHPRLHIFGPLEARLQRPDLIVLGSLNEGMWPQNQAGDPFLNRQMKLQLGIDPPERQTGLAAHDFQQMIASDEVVLTRSLRVDNTPSVASRWLQRLTTVIGEETGNAIKARGKYWLELGKKVERIDLDSGKKGKFFSTPPAQRPCPTPPVEKRPALLPVTDIENWIRDPYALYAKRILKLRPLPPLKQEADFMLRGNVYHDALAELQMKRNEWVGLSQVEIAEQLMELVDSELVENSVPENAALFWRHRMAEVAKLIAKWEVSRIKDVAEVFVETKGQIEVGESGFILTARADRIDKMHSGAVEIYDYKTGASPSMKMARTLSPQLALEGAITNRGGFKVVASSGMLTKLSFIRLKTGNALKVDSPEKDDVIGFGEDAYNNLAQLIERYQNPAQGYLSRYAPYMFGDLSGDYDHLARVREWSVSDPSSQGEDDG